MSVLTEVLLEKSLEQMPDGIAKDVAKSHIDTIEKLTDDQIKNVLDSIYTPLTVSLINLSNEELHHEANDLASRFAGLIVEDEKQAEEIKDFAAKITMSILMALISKVG